MTNYTLSIVNLKWLMALNKVSTSRWLGLMLRQEKWTTFLVCRLFVVNTLQISSLIFSIFCGVWSRTAKPSSL